MVLKEVYEKKEDIPGESYYSNENYPGKPN